MAVKRVLRGCGTVSGTFEFRVFIIIIIIFISGVGIARDGDGGPAHLP